MNKTKLIKIILIMIGLMQLGMASAVDMKRYRLQPMSHEDAQAQIGRYTKSIEAGTLSKEQLVTAYLNRSIAYLADKQFEKVIADTTYVIKEEPENVFALTNRGIALCHIGKVDSGMADLELSLKIEPTDPVAHYGLGSCYLLNNQYRESIAEFDRALSITPNNADGLKLRADAELAQGNLNLAEKDLQDAIKLAPRRSVLYTNLGLVYAKQGKEAQALAEFDKAIKLQPNDAAAHMLKGTWFFFHKKPREAVNSLNMAIQLDPKLSQAYKMRALSSLMLGNFDQAIRDYTQWIMDNPREDTSGDLYNRGYAHLMNGDYLLAIADFDLTTRSDEFGADSYYFRGVSRLMLDQLDKANADVEQAIRLKPGEPTYYLLAYITRAKLHSDNYGPFSSEIGKFDTNKWPAPILLLYQGKMNPDAVMELAEKTDVENRPKHKCQAAYYVGEYELSNNHNKGAQQLFREAASVCGVFDFEKKAATLELAKATQFSGGGIRH